MGLRCNPSKPIAKRHLVLNTKESPENPLLVFAKPDIRADIRHPHTPTHPSFRLLLETPAVATIRLNT